MTSALIVIDMLNPYEHILYSALDAYVRHFEVVVPRTAVAHIHEDLADAALRMMQENMRARIVESPSDALKAGSSR